MNSFIEECIKIASLSEMDGLVKLLSENKKKVKNIQNINQNRKPNCFPKTK
tara:strand:+ start:169 stop:321 length:153 start_codon:yes stop_codon:yes gene_type:complete